MEHYFSTLENTIREDWNRPALHNYGGESFTFGQVAENIEKFHIFFRAAGIKKGDKVALSARNSARWANAFLAITTYGAVAVPILNEFTPDSIAKLVSHSGALLLFTDEEIWQKIDPASTPTLKAVVNNADYSLLFSADPATETAFNCIEAAFAKKYPIGFGPKDICYPKDNMKDLSVINYTSGTTSAPKGVMLRYECFSAMVDFGRKRVPVSHDDGLVSMLPMGHIYGLVFEFLYPICHGCQVYYLGKTPSPSLLMKAMQEVKPYMVCTVPLVMEKVYKSSLKPVLDRWYMKVLLALPGVGAIIYRKIGEKLQAAFGGRVRNFIMGGAPLNPEVEKVFKKIHLPYTVGYGMTEASPLLAYESWDRYVPGSCGKAVSYAEVRIDSDDPQHIAGEILAKGTNICSGYYNNPEASANAFTEDGYLRTGDLGIIDAKGNIFIKGRCKTMILSANGQNIYPEEIEAVINSQEFVSESLALDRNGRIVVLIYPDSDAMRRRGLDAEAEADLPEKIRLAANRVLPAYSRIAQIEFVRAPFQKTPKMSIKRFMYK